MSGIIGIVNLDGAPVDRALLTQLTGYMTFRGPDQQNIWLESNVGFGHTLLRTTFEAKLERGVTSLDDQVWITADVRLDGRCALMNKLVTKGRTVTRDTTDVELVLHAYYVWGEAALDHLMGDFAFGIWDQQKQRLFCAHDHFGVVPFYYARVKSCLIFSNTLNVLRLHPAVSDTLNEQAIGDFLLFGHYPNLTTTTFVDIQRLPPAHSLLLLDKEVSVQRYYELPREIEYLRYRQPAQYVEHFRECFDQAVADRLRTDRAGTYLSGGMDSTSIAATVQKLFRQTGKLVDFRAYTIVYEELIPDQEGDYAGMVAEAIGLPIEYFVAETYLQRSPSEDPDYLLPEPSLIPNQVAESEINKRAAAYSRVIFAGFGGDPAFEPVPLLAYYGQLFKTGQMDLLAKNLHDQIRQRRFPRLGLRTYWRRFQRKAPPQPVVPGWLQRDFIERQELALRWVDMNHISPQRDRYGMMSAPLWTNIFAASDPGMTALPLRVRFPFFDLRLIQYLLRVPPIPWLQNKQLLRQAMAQRLPEPVRRRPKTILQGNPHARLAQRRGVQSWMIDLLTTPALAHYADTKQLVQLLQSGDKVTLANQRQLSHLFSLAYWFRQQRNLTPKGANSAGQAVDSYIVSTIHSIQEANNG